jgi:hypothetical protein
MYGGNEFYGIGVVQDPGPKPFVPAQGLRKVYIQEQVASENLNVDGRRYIMAKLAERAMDFLASQSWQIEWHTLTFQVKRTGMESDPNAELWRWEVWVR